MMLCILSYIVVALPPMPEDDPATWRWHIVAAIVGGLIGWWLKSRKLQAEIRKLESERRTLDIQQIQMQGDLLSKYQTARMEYSEECEKCGSSARDVIGAIRSNDKSAADAAREETCRIIAHCVIPALGRLVEWESKYFLDDESKIAEAMEQDNLPEIERIRRWVNVVNHGVFTERRPVGLAKLVIEERSFRPILRISDSLRRPDHDNVKRGIREAVGSFSDL